MKKLITLLFTSIIFNCLGSQTTMEEYNYVTKGYAIQLEGGFGNKEGYKFADLNKYGFENANVKEMVYIKSLIRTESGKAAAIMLQYVHYDKSSKKTSYKYLCIPHPNSSEEIFDKVMSDITSETSVLVLRAYNWALVNFSSNSFW